jgi:hypothetical protein
MLASYLKNIMYMALTPLQALSSRRSKLQAKGNYEVHAHVTVA